MRPGPRADRARDACNGRPDCVALLNPDPMYDLGLNEGIVNGIGRAKMAVGVQIVYSKKVNEVVIKAEEEDKPLLIYSWLPRVDLMTEERFVRMTMESFYHCEINSLATQQKPVACDFPIEQVEKVTHRDISASTAFLLHALSIIAPAPLDVPI